MIQDPKYIVALDLVDWKLDIAKKSVTTMLDLFRSLTFYIEEHIGNKMDDCIT